MSTAPTVTPRKKSQREKLPPKEQPRRTINFSDEEETKSAEPAALAPGASRQSSDCSDRIVKNDKNARIAYNWFQEESSFPQWFNKYCVFIKNNLALASEITKHGKKNKGDLVKWVHANVGFVPDADKLRKQDIVDIAFVAAGLTSRNPGDLVSEGNMGNMGNPRDAQNAQNDHAIHDTNIRTSYMWFKHDPTRFGKYRNYIKNNMALATEIAKHGKNKRDLFKWVYANVGFVPDTNELHIPDIVDIAVVAAGLTVHGVEELEGKYNEGNMNDLQNVALHAYPLRNNRSQQRLREQSESKNGEHAAHYVGLGVAAALNLTLPSDQRVGADALSKVVNIANNINYAPAKENLTLHKNVDKRLMDGNGRQTPLNEEEYERLKQIVKHARSDEFQKAVIETKNGRYFYLALRDRISRCNTAGRPRLWDGRNDPPNLQQCSTKSKSSGSGNKHTS